MKDDINGINKERDTDFENYARTKPRKYQTPPEMIILGCILLITTCAIAGKILIDHLEWQRSERLIKITAAQLRSFEIEEHNKRMAIRQQERWESAACSFWRSQEPSKRQEKAVLENCY